ncbi:MAG: Holliday junction resolvase RuvX [bacterium]|nr:Holliday junction resolvase RuvX [bacterium]
MRLLGIDYGKKRVGIAISDDKGMMAFPKAVLPNDNFLFGEIKNLVNGHDIKKIIIGESKDYKMNDNPIMSHIKAFKNELERDLGMEVIYETEILSSHQASHFQSKTNMTDASAASIILQSYIDRTKNKNNLKK